MRVSERIVEFVKKHPLGCIIGASAIFQLLLLMAFGVTVWSDTPTYLIAWDKLSSGMLGAIRTPSYPLLLGIMNFVFGHYSGYAVVIFQLIVFLISIKYFWYSATNLIHTRKIIFWITAFYALAPGIFNLNLCLITDSLALSGMVILFALLLRLRKSLKVRYAVTFVLLQIFLTFLRPALLYMFVVLSVIALIWAFQKFYKQAAVILFSMAVSLSLLYGYAKLMEKQYGVFMISSVSLVNDTLIFIKDESLSEKVHFSDPEKAVKFQALQMNTHGAREEAPMPMVEWHDLLSEAKQSTGFWWYWFAYRRVLTSENGLALWCCAEIPIIQTIEYSLGLKMNVLYSILFIYTLILLYILIKRKDINWANWTLCLACYGNIGVMTIGSFDEWARLFLPSVPFILLMLGQMLSSVRIDIRAYLKPK
jgi:hypothetical protein